MDSSFFKNATKQQKEHIDKMLTLIRKYAPQLIESEGDSKWTDGNIIFKFENSQPGDYVYMINPLANGSISLHIMPFYGVKEYVEKYGEALKPFEAGKSCIHFKSYNDLDEKILIDIIENGTDKFKEIIEEMRSKRR